MMMMMMMMMMIIIPLAYGDDNDMYMYIVGYATLSTDSNVTKCVFVILNSSNGFII